MLFCVTCYEMLHVPEYVMSWDVACYGMLHVHGYFML